MRDQQIFTIKTPNVNILNFPGYTVSVKTIEICCCIMKAALEDI